MKPGDTSLRGGARWIALGFHAQMVTAGMTTYALGVFMLPVADAMGASRLQITSALAWNTAVGALIAPLAGRWVDRGRPERVILVGAIWFGAALGAMSLARSLLQMWALLVAGVAVGAMLCGSIPAAALLVRHFSKGRARALGIASTGTAVGGMIVPPLAGTLIAGVGWRTALAVLGVGAAGSLVALVWVLTRRSTATAGTRAADSPVPPPDPPAPLRALARELLARGDFWAIAIPIGLIYASNTALITLLPSLAADLGMDAARGSTAVSVLALGSVAGKLGYSAIGDRVDPRAPIWLAGLAQVAGLGALLSAPAYPLLIAAALLSGLGVGALLPGWSALVALCFGPERFGAVMGFTRWVMYAVMNTGALLAAHLRDETAAFQASWMLLATGSALAVGVGLLLRIPPQEDSGAA